MHINLNHPKKSTDKESENFGLIGDRLGAYELFTCCSKKKTKISELSKEIGLGPSIFLMSTKSMIFLFFWLTILNLPVYVLFYKANDQEPAASVQDYVAKLSLGNIVYPSDHACNSINYASQIT